MNQKEAIKALTGREDLIITDMGSATNGYVIRLEEEPQKGIEEPVDNPIWRQMQEEFKKWGGQLVLVDFRVALFLDIYYGKHGLYYKFAFEHREVTSYEASGCTPIPLKGIISDEEYNRMVYIWNNNNNYDTI